MLLVRAVENYVGYYHTQDKSVKRTSSALSNQLVGSNQQTAGASTPNHRRSW